jgi:EF-P beta-lysylation protein EpmB
MDGMLAPQLPVGEALPSRARSGWATQLAEARRPAQIATELGWPSDLIARFAGANFGFETRATRHYLSLVNPGNPADPVLRQVLPDPNEGTAPPPGYSLDAVGDTLEQNAVAPGLIHKYPGRALMVVTGACAVNCRFCFRRNYPYSEINQGGAGGRAALDAVSADPSITELILSGGDPLCLPDQALGALFARIRSIPHLKRVRIHTRIPVVLPDRIDAGLLTLFKNQGPALQLWVVTHFNCQEELAPEALAACGRLLKLGIPVLNQSVLLRGVNDTAEQQAALQEGLTDAGIKPYYLHQLDKVAGVAHFEVPQAEGERLVTQLRSRISGIAMPQWVQDLPGQPSKTPLPVARSGKMERTEPS